MATYSPQFGPFFGQLYFQYKIYQRYKCQTDRFLASDFNTFKYINPDENKLSEMVADLLSPTGKHGQHIIFLELFIKMLRLEITNPQLLQTIQGALANPHVKIKISTEPKTSHIQNNQRRMDILIEIDQYGVMIENKPWAQDQNKQLVDYIAHLANCFPQGFVAVYLSGNGTSPDPISLPDNLKKRLTTDGQYIEINYFYFLKSWLQACQKETEADKVRAFLRDFIDYIGQKFYI